MDFGKILSDIRSRVPKTESWFMGAHKGKDDLILFG